MRELLLGFDDSDGRRVGLERALRDSIRSGRLVAGTSLPSTRALAADLGLSRATVVAAYEQLGIEGYLVSKRGSGTVVADVPAPVDRSDREISTPRPVIDFMPGQPDGSLFPRTMWMRALRRASRDASDEAFGYGDPNGAVELRVALAEYLGRSRSVVADEHTVRIFNGAVNSFAPLAAALHHSGVRRIAIEDPCFPFVRMQLIAAGLEVVGVPVDNDGLDLDALHAADVGAVVVAPAHQYPLGVTMSADRRAGLIAWARDHDGWIIEDDYDGEFRYDRQPIGSLQGLGPERVVYVGTASKMLSPALRISWLVVPTGLRAALTRFASQPGVAPTLDQLALAVMFGRGDVDRHLRIVRPIYQRRQDELLNVLNTAGSWLSATGSAAGLHLSCRLDEDGPSESGLIRRAADHNIGLLGLGPHWVDHRGAGRSRVDVAERPQGLVVGYSRPPQHRFAADLEALAEFLAGVDR